MKKIIFFLPALLSLAIYVNAQNSSPYWSLSGNTNATSSSKLGTANAINLRLFTNNSERIRINTSGLVGINTTSPTARLQVNSSSGQDPFRAQVNGTTKFILKTNGGATVGGGSTPPANGLYVVGDVGIGTATPSYKLHVTTAGTAIYGNSTGGSSYGVWGNSTYLGVYGSGSTYGVYGSSANNYGVYGISGYLGVYGSGNSYGLYGSGGTTGVFGSGSSYGVRGTSTSNYGVYGASTNYVGVYGGGGTYGVYGNGSSYGVYGNSGYAGIFGKGSSYGLSGEGSYGISANGTSYGIWAQSGDGYAFAGRSTNGQGANIFSTNNTGIVVGTDRTDKNWAAIFNGNVYAYGSYLGSDKALKKNIEPLGDAMQIIARLKPAAYEFVHEGKLAGLRLPGGKHYGLIAQELEEVLPSLVKTSTFSTDMSADGQAATSDSSKTKVTAEPKKREQVELKSVNYIELIPILIAGMQQLSAKNEALESELNELKSLILKDKPTLTSSAAFLKQNIPNPSNHNTVISYYVPANSGYAQIKITDAKGRLVKTFSAAKGEGHINIKSSELPAGTYNYTLYINNKTVDTKQMVLVK